MNIGSSVSDLKYWWPNLRFHSYKSSFSCIQIRRFSKFLSIALKVEQKYRTIHHRYKNPTMVPNRHCTVMNSHPYSLEHEKSYLDTFFFAKYTLPHHLIKENNTDLIEITFQRNGSLYNDRNAFFTSEKQKRCTFWFSQKVCEVLKIECQTMRHYLKRVIIHNYVTNYATSSIVASSVGHHWGRWNLSDKNGVFEMDGYKCYGIYRQNLHVNFKKGSWSVGCVLLKRNVQWFWCDRA